RYARQMRCAVPRSSRARPPGDPASARSRLPRAVARSRPRRSNWGRTHSLARRRPSAGRQTVAWRTLPEISRPRLGGPFAPVYRRNGGQPSGQPQEFRLRPAAWALTLSRGALIAPADRNDRISSPNRHLLDSAARITTRAAFIGDFRWPFL